MLTITNLLNTAVIPAPIDWSISSERPQASRQTLRGTMIHQYAAKSVTVSAPKVSQTVTEEQAASINAIDTTGGVCYLSDGERLFLVTIDAKVSGAPLNNKTVNIEFRIIREITW